MIKKPSWMFGILCLLMAFILVGCAHAVFIVGGMDSNGRFHNDADIYDPATRTFTAASSTMSTGRTNATATTLANNAVLVAGGQGSTAGNTAETYNNTFVPTVGRMNHNRIAHTATLLNSEVVTGPLANHVLLAGGDGFSTTGTAEIYNPATKTFINTTNMLTPRTQHVAVLISHCGCAADGKVLVIGGYDNQSHVLASAELYDPVTQTFKATGTMQSPRFRHSATLLKNGTVLIAGGLSQIGAKPNDTNPALNSAEIYDPKTGKFTLINHPMNAYRAAQGASLLDDGTVLITGGQDQHFLIENTAEIYNPTTNKFTALSASCNGAPAPAGCMRSGRDFHISEKLDDGTVLLAGGADSNFVALASAEIYSPVTKTFTATGNMTRPRLAAASALILSGVPKRHFIQKR